MGFKSYVRTLITVREAAEMLGLAESTVYNRKAGTKALQRVKQGRTVRLVKQQVEEHIEKLTKSR